MTLCVQAPAEPELPRTRPQRARSGLNLSTESGGRTVSYGPTDSGEDAGGGDDEADMEEEVLGARQCVCSRDQTLKAL